MMRNDSDGRGWGSTFKQKRLNTPSVRQLAIDLLEWNGGMGSGLYSVGSFLYGGHEPEEKQIRRAIDELRDLRRDAKFPECVTDDDVSECAALALRLEELFLKNESEPTP